MVMHDLLEGALPFEVKEMLKVFLTRGYFSRSELTKAVETFPYTGPDIRNKPTPPTTKTLASKDHSLKQTGLYNELCAWFLASQIMYSVNA